VRILTQKLVSRASALQAALALLLRQHLRIRGPLLLYDPVLTENEKAAAPLLGFTMLQVNEVGARGVNTDTHTKTRFRMPYCDSIYLLY
jgi:hypothetical protein